MFLKPFLIVPLELLARSEKRGFIFYDQPAPTTACPQQMAIKEIWYFLTLKWDNLYTRC